MKQLPLSVGLLFGPLAREHGAVRLGEGLALAPVREALGVQSREVDRGIQQRVRR